MLRLSGGQSSDPDHTYGSFPQPPLGAGHRCVVYEPHPTVAAAARAEVRGRMEDWGLMDHSETAELLVSELVTNALLHARGRLRLTLTAAHGVLRCEVSDVVGSPPRLLREVGADEEGGRGMFLVEALARRWGCEQDEPGKTVWFELGTCGSDG
ncbi:ATP-binding protein [Streptomyces cavernae]|uniref:ATP-binding protein n=1 Tax=Streptomyces cavernae TaxID=2259034 RepID=UPI000FEBC082|nr:ATP-binding protein [Streptomyces cavernae]